MSATILSDQFHDLSAESAVVAAMILDPKEIPAIRQTIGAEDIHRPELRLIFQAVSDCYEEIGTDIDQILIRDRMKEQGTLEQAGGADFLVQVVDSTPSAASWPHHAAIVRRDSELRRRYVLLSRALAVLGDGQDTDSKLAEVDTLLAEIGLGSGPRNSALEVVCLKDIQTELTDWLWLNRFPASMLSLLAGVPGQGKSFVGIDMAARISRGAPWPDNPTIFQEPGETLYFAFEDHIRKTVSWRFDVSKADRSKIHICRSVKIGGRSEVVDVNIHLPMMLAFAKTHPALRLIVFDPISSAMGECRQNENAEVRKALGILCQFAESENLTILAITHLNKNKSADPLGRVIGSTGFSAVARAVWGVQRDEKSEDDPSPNRQFFCLKNSCSEVETGMQFQIVDGAIVWDSEPSIRSASEILYGGGIGSPEQDKAVEFLEGLFAAESRIESDLVSEQAKMAGIDESTLKRAKKRMGFTSVPVGIPGRGNRWYWIKP